MKALPYVRKHAFYGNYGGCGNVGGKPIDRLDSICRKHDIVYDQAKALPTLRMADHVFAQQLRTLDPSTLTPEGLSFRNRGIRFMEGPLANYIGKPFENLHIRHEPPESPFQTIDDIREFFRLSEGAAETRFFARRSPVTARPQPGRGPVRAEAPR